MLRHAAMLTVSLLICNVASAQQPFFGNPSGWGGGGGGYSAPRYGAPAYPAPAYSTPAYVAPRYSPNCPNGLCGQSGCANGACGRAGCANGACGARPTICGPNGCYSPASTSCPHGNCPRSGSWGQAPRPVGNYPYGTPTPRGGYPVPSYGAPVYSTPPLPTYPAYPGYYSGAASGSGDRLTSSDDDFVTGQPFDSNWSDFGTGAYGGTLR